MNRLLASIKKEFLVLIRDWAGLGLIFLMPVALVLVMTLIQDASFRKLDETRITLVYLDDDHDTLGIKVKEGLEKAGYFELITTLKNSQLDEKALKEQVAGGKFQMGVVVRAGSTEAIRARGQRLVEQTLSGETQQGLTRKGDTSQARIVIYFDPAIKISFKVTVRNALENFTSKIEAGILFQSLSTELANYLPEPPGPLPDPGGGIIYEEIYAADEYTEIIPNSVQHNVPAWTIFAMFFIIIPLTGNLVREKESGLATRLRVMPGGQFQALGAKIVVYSMVGIIQFLIILAFAKLVFPLFDLPSLVMGPEKTALFLMALATTLAATGYSLLVGTVARTHDQAAVFGMVSVIILAAIGGIWVPVFMMTNLMQAASIISPLNWSLDGFYDILLRGSGIRGILGNFFALLAFFIVNLGIAIWVNGRRVRL
jgi:ABC-2 type transport system permease protein